MKWPEKKETEQEGETSNDLAFQKGYAAGFKAQTAGLVPIEGEYRVIESLDGISVGLGSNPITPLQFMTMDNAVLICDLLNRTTSPKVLTVEHIEEIISHSDLWKYQVTRTGLQRDKRHLAQEIHKAQG